jgi:hypothetical protein
MSAHTTGDWLLLYATAAIVVAQAVYFKTWWERPLKNGPAFFLGVNVPAGFYQGEGVGWLRLYRTLLIAEDLVVVVVLVGILLSGRWFLLPAWAGGLAVLQVSAFSGFVAYTRSKLGDNPPVRTAVSIQLEPRRLANYISWREETIIAVTVTLSWALLVLNHDATVRWNAPVVLSYVIVGLLPFKIAIARSSFPLPAEQTEEHQQWMEAGRRYGLRVVNFSRWLIVVALLAYTLQHSWRFAGRSGWFLWLSEAAFSAIWVYMVVSIIRGQRRLDTMGRDLLPPGSWSTPFRRARIISPSFAAWFAAWFCGLVLLLVFFRK